VPKPSLDMVRYLGAELRKRTNCSDIALPPQIEKSLTRLRASDRTMENNLAVDKRTEHPSNA
jgi:hypothetical protein